MATTNQECIGEAMELRRLRRAPLAEREFRGLHKAQRGAEGGTHMSEQGGLFGDTEERSDS